MPFSRFLLLFLLATAVLSGSGQPLTWQPERLLTDTRESGAFPDFFIDAQGGFHVSFWDKSENALRYARRSQGASWEIETIAPQPAGIRSAIVADEAGQAHVAFLEAASNGQARLRYARRDPQGWVLQTLVGDTLTGPYLPETAFPVYRQPSLDIQLTASGKPFVAFFHGWIGQLFTCNQNNQISYLSYLLELRVLVQQPDGSWLKAQIPNVPGPSPASCFPRGDRFGEYCAIARGPQGRHFIFTTAMHSKQALLFQASDSSLSHWRYTVIDSMQRHIQPNLIGYHFTYEHLAAARGNDTTLHLAYGLSNLYGNLSIAAQRPGLFYSRFNPASAFDSLPLAPFRRDLAPVKDGIYRRFLNIAARGADSVYYAWYDELNSQVVIARSVNRGVTFVNDTIRRIVTNARFNLLIHQDSLFALIYDANQDQLRLFASALGGRSWAATRVTRTESRAFQLDAAVLRLGNETQQFVALDERLNGQLFFGKKSGGLWSWQPVDTEGQRVSGISMGLDTDLSAVVAYSWRDANRLRIWKEGHSPRDLVPPGIEAPRSLRLALADDGWRLLYYDAAARRLRYGFAPQWDAPWNIVTLDSASGNTGMHLDLAISPQGVTHAAWWDEADRTLRYASRPPGGGWTISTIPDQASRLITQVRIAPGQGEAVWVAFRDNLANGVFVAGLDSGSWTIAPVASNIGNLVGQPLDLLTDHRGRPWVVYNVSDALDLPRLARRNDQGQWQEVSIIPNPDFLANAFVFLRDDLDFYLFGRANPPATTGLGLLFAANGATTSIEPALAGFPSARVAPNPVTDRLTLQWDQAPNQPFTATLLDLQGRALRVWQVTHTELSGHSYDWDIADLPAGVYLLRIASATGALTLRVLK